MFNIPGLHRPVIIAAALLVMGSWSAQASPGDDDMQTRIAAPKAGALLSLQTQRNTATLAHAGQRYLITYRSRGVHDEPIVASGFVLLPKGEPPKGGWPVLAWAHGTTGVADVCAPSADYPGGPVHDYQQVVERALDGWLADGYAVVAPDYQGLGTPGGHPYMNAASQRHTVIDAVRAIHELRPQAFNSNWLVMGHSQGGAAALEVAAHGQADAPEFKLRGAIAIAPGGYRYADIAQYARDHPRLDPGVAAFFPIVLLGAQAANPSLSVDYLVSADMLPLLDRARSQCLSGLREAIVDSPASVFKTHADLKPLLGYLDRQAIEHMSPTVPVMLIQGTADASVDAHGTHAYYRQLCKAGKTAFYHPIPDGSHRDALRLSPPIAQAFLAHLDGGKSLQACPPAHGAASPN